MLRHNLQNISYVVEAHRTRDLHWRKYMNGTVASEQTTPLDLYPSLQTVEDKGSPMSMAECLRTACERDSLHQPQHELSRIRVTEVHIYLHK